MVKRDESLNKGVVVNEQQTQTTPEVKTSEQPKTTPAKSRAVKAVVQVSESVKPVSSVKTRTVKSTVQPEVKPELVAAEPTSPDDVNIEIMKDSDKEKAKRKSQKEKDKKKEKAKKEKQKEKAKKAKAKEKLKEKKKKEKKKAKAKKDKAKKKEKQNKKTKAKSKNKK